MGRNATATTQTHEGGCPEVKVEGANAQLKAQKNHLLLDQSLAEPSTEGRSPTSRLPVARDSPHWCFGILVLQGFHDFNVFLKTELITPRRRHVPCFILDLTKYRDL